MLQNKQRVPLDHYNEPGCLYPGINPQISCFGRSLQWFLSTIHKQKFVKKNPVLCESRAVKWNEQLESSIELDSLIEVNESSSNSNSRYARLINKSSKFDSSVIRVVRLGSIRKGIFVILQFKSIIIENYRFLVGLICMSSSSCKLGSFMINESTSSSSYMSHLVRRVRTHFKTCLPNWASSNLARIHLGSSLTAKYSVRLN